MHFCLSIPHASSPPNGHQGLSISPTNLTSPIKESLLANEEHPQELSEDVEGASADSAEKE